MRKLYTTLLGVLLLSTLGFSQSLDITGPYPSYYITAEVDVGAIPDQDIEFHCNVTNTSNNAMPVRVFRDQSMQAPGHSNYICWGAGCYSSLVDTSVADDTPTLMAQETNGTFYGHLKPNDQTGVSTIKYCFYDTLNPSDSSCIFVTWDITPVGIAENKTKVSLGAPYPNPTNESVQIAFDIQDAGDNTTVSIYSAMGRLIRTETLNGQQGLYRVNTSDFAAGLYYISMQSGDSSLATRKFTVTK